MTEQFVPIFRALCDEFNSISTEVCLAGENIDVFVSYLEGHELKSARAAQINLFSSILFSTLATLSNSEHVQSSMPLRSRFENVRSLLKTLVAYCYELQDGNLNLAKPWYTSAARNETVSRTNSSSEAKLLYPHVFPKLRLEAGLDHVDTARILYPVLTTDHEDMRNHPLFSIIAEFEEQKMDKNAFSLTLLAIAYEKGQFSKKKDFFKAAEYYQASAQLRGDPDCLASDRYGKLLVFVQPRISELEQKLSALAIRSKPLFDKLEAQNRANTLRNDFLQTPALYAFVAELEKMLVSAYVIKGFKDNGISLKKKDNSKSFAERGIDLLVNSASSIPLPFTKPIAKAVGATIKKFVKPVSPQLCFDLPLEEFQVVVKQTSLFFVERHKAQLTILENQDAVRVARLVFKGIMDLVSDHAQMHGSKLPFAEQFVLAAENYATKKLEDAKSENSDWRKFKAIWRKPKSTRKVNRRSKAFSMVIQDADDDSKSEIKIRTVASVTADVDESALQYSGLSFYNPSAVWLTDDKVVQLSTRSAGSIFRLKHIEAANAKFERLVHKYPAVLIFRNRLQILLHELYDNIHVQHAAETKAFEAKYALANDAVYPKGMSATLKPGIAKCYKDNKLYKVCAVNRLTYASPKPISPFSALVSVDIYNEVVTQITDRLILNHFHSLKQLSIDKKYKYCIEQVARFCKKAIKNFFKKYSGKEELSHDMVYEQLVKAVYARADGDDPEDDEDEDEVPVGPDFIVGSRVTRASRKLKKSALSFLGKTPSSMKPLEKKSGGEICSVTELFACESFDDYDPNEFQPHYIHNHLLYLTPVLDDRDIKWEGKNVEMFSHVEAQKQLDFYRNANQSPNCAKFITQVTRRVVAGVKLKKTKGQKEDAAQVTREITAYVTPSENYPEKFLVTYKYAHNRDAIDDITTPEELKVVTERAMLFLCMRFHGVFEQLTTSSLNIVIDFVEKTFTQYFSNDKSASSLNVNLTPSLAFIRFVKLNFLHAREALSPQLAAELSNQRTSMSKGRKSSSMGRDSLQQAPSDMPKRDSVSTGMSAVKGFMGKASGVVEKPVEYNFKNWSDIPTRNQNGDWFDTPRELFQTRSTHRTASKIIASLPMFDQDEWPGEFEYDQPLLSCDHIKWILPTEDLTNIQKQLELEYYSAIQKDEISPETEAEIELLCS